MPYKDSHSPEARESQRKRTAKYQQTEKGKITIARIRKKRAQKQKLICLVHYGGNPPRCACCGETMIEFLSIDHINGGGTQHFKRIHAFGQGFYCWLIKKEFPEGYRVLCMNCNFSLGHYGYCPHNPKEKILESMGIRLPHNSFRKRSA